MAKAKAEPPVAFGAAVIEEEVAGKAEAPAAASAAAPRPGREPARPTKKPGEKRELEQAPQLLRKAATIVGVGALFPFFSALDPDSAIAWGPLMGAKALACVAGYVFHQGYMATHGGKAAPPIANLAKANKLVPSILAGLIAIGSIVVAFGCPHAGYSIGEVLTLLLALATFSHIWGYEHGGKFNPLYPLMFLGPAIAGVLNVLGAAAAFGVTDHPGNPLLGMLGSLTVGAGGVLATYTMYVAIKQAKAEGDIKREQMREYRKQQRDAQRAQRAAKQKSGDS